MTNLIDGIDVSNLNDIPSTTRLPEYKDVRFGIVQAIPRGPTTTQQWLDRLAADRKKRGIYTWLWHDPTWRLDPDVATDQWLRLHTINPYTQLDGRPWLDLEDNQSSGWNRVTVQKRINEARAALRVLDQFADSHRLPHAGVYSSPYFQSLLYNGWDWDGREYWQANYNGRPGSVLGGMTVGHQWTSQPIDLDVFLETEFIKHMEDPTMLNVGQGLRDQMAANGDHPITDEFTEYANNDGTVVQCAFGLKGKYRSTNATGSWENAGPFDA